ncbi:D-TA family PLP-dependent enzyme [Aureimonas altamirensis]|uniref:D-TA family PLP-dependent enzyme n=1 Tax=Aureimonas altamirensis TaxID=370622 RepID=UPI0020372B36|nr:D-TA family PLP-dependent enzyme [Aureimonas altamirensis]MCM2502695.1 D-TA family PLP-dependent enzyme [Aureimonas altamirensis]
MQLSTIDDIETPAVLVDLKTVRANIERFQAHADAMGLLARPHIKTHKLPAIAAMQIAAGAVGITCQKVGEAEAMVAGHPEISDVLITYNILGAAKVARLKDLSGKVKLSVVADNATVVDGLSAGFADAAEPLRVLVECDTGGKRCGVTSPEAAHDLAVRIAAAPGLVFDGLMTYPAAGGAATAAEFLKAAKALIEAEGIEVARVTSGGTPDIWQSRTDGIVTEYRPGTYVYNDRSLVARGVAELDDCALTVLATVVSVPTPGRAIIDAGSKVLTSDLLGLTGHGAVLGRPDLSIDQLSEEHGRIVSDGPVGLSVGDRVRIVPNHACVVTNMFDSVHVLLEDGAIERWDVPARGKVV